MTKLVDLPPREHLLPGNRACAGCALGIGLRSILKALEGKTIMTVPASCLTVLGGMYPISSVTVPWLNVAFPGAAAAGAGLAAGLRATGRAGELTVLAMAGDGGTADIGLQGLSGAAERNDDFIYVCYDNEGYMNTGIQRSGTTPYGAVTTTSPAGEKRPMQLRKDMVKIMAAHGIPYAATAAIAYPLDLVRKVRKAVAIDGPTYIHILSPCWTGWGFSEALSVKISKLAVQTGMWILYEVEDGATRPTVKITQRKPVEEYLKAQSRFSKLTKADVERIQQFVDNRCKEFGM